MRRVKWVLLGLLAALLAAAGVFLFTPYRGTVDAPDCADALGLGTFAGPTYTTSVDISAQLNAEGGSAGFFSVGSLGGQDAAVVAATVPNGGRIRCALVVGRVYNLGSGQVRLDAIKPTAPWMDLTMARRAKAYVTVSKGD